MARAMAGVDTAGEIHCEIDPDSLPDELKIALEKVKNLGRESEKGIGDQNGRGQGQRQRGSLSDRLGGKGGISGKVEDTLRRIDDGEREI